MTRPSHSETVLDEQECRGLLHTCSVGRVAFTERALPVIYPAHFVVDGNEIVFAALPDGRVSCARQHAVLAFEVDVYDPAKQEGWCVCTLGPSRLITDATRVRELDALGFTPWANRADRHYVAVRIEILRGKRLSRSAAQNQ